jgi:thioredoxin 1
MAVLDLTKDNFDKTVNENDFVLVDFWAPWCAPCRSFAPIYEKVSSKHPDAVFAKVNTEEERALAGYFNIRSIPTLMVFREQIIIYSEPGMLPERALEDLLDKVEALDMDEVRQSLGKPQDQ